MALPRPYILTDVTLEMADKTGQKHQFSCWLTGFNLTAQEGTTTDVTSLCPQVGTVKLAGAPGSWTLNLDYLADWCNTDSFSWFLANNEGASNLAWTIIDRAGCNTGVQITGVASSLPMPGFGGSAGTPATFTGVAVPLEAKPVVTAAAAAALASTVATSSTGGTFGPIGSMIPKDLAELKGSATIGDGGTAAPSTDTPAGEYVHLADGSKAHYKTKVWGLGIAS